MNTFKSKTCVVTYNENQEILDLKFEGIVDDTLDLVALFRLLQPLLKTTKSVSITASGITRMNSVGIRSWLIFMRELSLCTHLHFTRIGELLIEHFAFHTLILGKEGTPVDELDLPYLCEACQVREMKTHTTPALFALGNPLTPPDYSCSKCGNKMYFDAIEADYEYLLDYLKAASS